MFYLVLPKAQPEPLGLQAEEDSHPGEEKTVWIPIRGKC